MYNCAVCSNDGNECYACGGAPLGDLDQEVIEHLRSIETIKAIRIESTKPSRGDEDTAKIINTCHAECSIDFCHREYSGEILWRK